MEKEKIIKEYDPVILKKLAVFTRPHFKWIIVGLLSLVIATATELIKPVIIQKTIDNNILPHYNRLRDSTAEIPGVKGIKIAGSVYYKKKDISPENKSLADPALWPLEKINTKNSHSVQSRSDVFINNNFFDAISDSDFQYLSV